MQTKSEPPDKSPTAAIRNVQFSVSKGAARRPDAAPRIPRREVLFLERGWSARRGKGVGYLPRSYLNKPIIAFISLIINLKGAVKISARKYTTLWKKAVSFPKNEVPWFFPHNLQILFDSAFSYFSITDSILLTSSSVNSFSSERSFFISSISSLSTCTASWEKV